jgi:hypothetical protein
MTTLIIDVPESLARQLEPLQEQLVEILELGLQAITPSHKEPYLDIVDYLASGPSPEELANSRASPAIQERIAELLDKNRQGIISADEAAELDRYEQLDYLMTLVKLRARRLLRNQ